MERMPAKDQDSTPQRQSFISYSNYTLNSSELICRKSLSADEDVNALVMITRWQSHPQETEPSRY